MSDHPAPTSSDTSFRKTWNRAEYAEKARQRDLSEKADAALRRDAQLHGHQHHHHARARTPPDVQETRSRTTRLDVSALVGKTSLVPAGASTTGKRGRGAGFYCGECDLTFKDNVQFVEHLNSRQHLVATGRSGEVRRATLGEVRERLGWLGRRRREEREGVGGVDLGGRLEGRKGEEEREREERRRRRNEKRRRTEGGVGVRVEEGGGGGIIC